MCQLEAELILHWSDRSMSDEVWYFWELWGFTTAESWRSMSFSGEASQRSAAWRIRGTGYWSMTPHYVTVSIKTNDIKSGLTVKFLTQLNSFLQTKTFYCHSQFWLFGKKCENKSGKICADWFDRVTSKLTLFNPARWIIFYYEDYYGSFWKGHRLPFPIYLLCTCITHKSLGETISKCLALAFWWTAGFHIWRNPPGSDWHQKPISPWLWERLAWYSISSSKAVLIRSRCPWSFFIIHSISTKKNLINKIDNCSRKII